MIHPERLSIIFAIFLCFLGIWIIHSFIPVIAWSGILAIATWPLFKKIDSYIKYKIISSSIVTIIVGIGIGLPLIGFLIQVGFDINHLWSFIQSKSSLGISVPDLIKDIPSVGNKVHSWWLHTLSKQNGLVDLIQTTIQKDPQTLIPKIHEFGSSILNRSIQFILTLFVLGFIYYSGDNWIAQLHRRGHSLFGERWLRYIQNVAPAIRAIVNGLFLVACIEAVGMGVAFYFAEVPSFILAASIIGLLSIIPGLAMGITAIILLYLWYYGTLFGFILVLVASTILLGLFDNWARPFFIGNTIKLPFLPIFFSILGGFETLGLIGIFIGPTIFMMIKTLWDDIDLNIP